LFLTGMFAAMVAVEEESNSIALREEQDGDMLSLIVQGNEAVEWKTVHKLRRKENLDEEPQSPRKPECVSNDVDAHMR